MKKSIIIFIISFVFIFNNIKTCDFGSPDPETQLLLFSKAIAENKITFDIKNEFPDGFIILQRLINDNRIDLDLAYKVAEKFLEYGIDINTYGSPPVYRGNALDNAVVEGDLNSVKLLISLNADVNIGRKSKNDIPLIQACRAKLSNTPRIKNYEEIVKLLIEAGADLNYQAYGGRTALIKAAIRNQPRIVFLLLINGADTTLKDQLGKTFFDYAKEKPEVLEAFEKFKKYKKAKRQQVYDTIPTMPDVLVDMISEYDLKKIE